MKVAFGMPRLPRSTSREATEELLELLELSDMAIGGVRVESGGVRGLQRWEGVAWQKKTNAKPVSARATHRRRNDERVQQSTLSSISRLWFRCLCH